MSESPPPEGWYDSGRGTFEQMKARGALKDGAGRIIRGDHFAGYRRLRQAEAVVDAAEARRIRGLIHAAVAGVKLERGDARGAARQLDRARSRLAEGAPTLAAVDVDAVVEAVEQRLRNARPAEDPPS